MNAKIEKLLPETQQTPAGEEREELTSPQATEIAPLPLDSFRLVGGGSGILTW